MPLSSRHSVQLNSASSRSAPTSTNRRNNQSSPVSSPLCNAVIVVTGSRFGFPGSYGKTRGLFFPSSLRRFPSCFLSRQGNFDSRAPPFPPCRPSFSLGRASLHLSRGCSLFFVCASTSTPSIPFLVSCQHCQHRLPPPPTISSASSRSHVRFVFVFPASSILFCLLRSSSLLSFYLLLSLSLSLSFREGAFVQPSLSSSIIPDSVSLTRTDDRRFFGCELDELSRRKSGYANSSRGGGRGEGGGGGGRGGGGLGRALGGNNSRRVVTTR